MKSLISLITLLSGVALAAAPGSTFLQYINGTTISTVSQANGLPVQIAGSGFNVTQGTTPWIVSGTTTSNQGTNPWTVNGTVSLTAGASPLPVQAYIGSNPWNVTGTVNRTWNLSSPADAVSVYQGTNPWNITGTVATTGTTTTTVNGSVSVNQVGQNAVTFVRNDYTSTNVTTSAWVQLFAAMPALCNSLEIFDSSGQTLKIGFGGSGSEVAKFVVYPGGNGRIPVTVPALTRVSIEAITGTANTGEIDITCYQ